MDIKSETVFQGPNSLLPAATIVLLLDQFGDLASLTEQQLVLSVDRVKQAIQSADTSPVLGPIDSEFFRRSPSLIVAELVAQTALIFQKQYLYATERWSAMPRPKSEAVLAAYEFHDLGLGLIAGRQATAIWSATIANSDARPDALRKIYDEFKKRADAAVPHLEARMLLQEAGRRNIPWFRVAEGVPIFQLGQGVKQRRFRNALSCETTDTAFRLASLKPIVAQMLQEHGIAVPMQAVVANIEQAVNVAYRIGFPVVIKPINQDMGVGVRVGISDETELKAVFSHTRTYGLVQVEKYLPGFDYRFTFVRGALVGVLCTMPPIIFGDGRAAIRQLIEAEPVTTPTFVSKKVIVDEEVLARIASLGYSLDDILPAGERIVLRKWWRNQKDHMLENVTAVTHPENIEAALLAVQLVGLDVAGVDYLTTDISRPYYETGGAFTEVNPMPALAGVQRCNLPAYRMLLEAFFPPGDDGRIPTVVILGPGNSGRAVSIAADMLSQLGYCVGVGTRSRFEVAGKPIRRAPASETNRIRSVLRDPRSTAAILETAVDTIANLGLAIDQCDVGVIAMTDDVTKRAADSESRSRAAALICSIARKAVVIGCDDLQTEALISAAAGKRILWVAPEPDGSRRRPDLRSGDKVITWRLIDGAPVVELVDEQTTQVLAPVPMRFAGDDETTSEVRRQTLIAVAIALALELPHDIIVGAIAEDFRALDQI